MSAVNGRASSPRPASKASWLSSKSRGRRHGFGCRRAIDSGDSSATCSISMPPFAESIRMLLRASRSTVKPRYTSRSISSAASQYTSGTLNPLMSIPMICAAAWRASSGDFTSLMPPALPRPPTGTCALTATGPSSAQAFAASSGVRATLPGGIGMPSDARTSLAWYSRSFTTCPDWLWNELLSRRGRRERANEVGVAAGIAVAEAALEVGIADDGKHRDDAEQEDHDQGDTAAD